ncbi:hypothetical protein DW775_08355 [Agathobacter rectalis]|uniref:Cell wall-associated polypeptide CWBP200 n=1 Tax=Agathobacter rectalis TaxID=39491 RepID=A0A414HY82_9FIRM|nr:DUF6531 domain-containing protein [Agathobacter rectalis]RHD94314.1 hypothetical protein DW775_08355 [Agathobacter rectalis]
MTRDFSEKAKQKLEGYADDAAASSTWGKIKDWFSDRGMDFQSWTGKLGIENYINDVDTYHQKIIDKNNATKKKIDTIFSNVQSVDTKSMAAMNRQITCGNNIIKLINDLAASISPDGGNLDMAGMKGTLDADAARIKNPESAKSEKTEKEKLGAGDTSCKKSSDPVNLSTGNFIYDHEDMQAGGEIPLSFHRYYNSKDTGTGTMGSCFLHNYEMEVQKQPDQKAAVRMHDGQFYYFAETDTGYVAENAAMGLLERTEDGYKLTCHPGMDAVYFDENGKAARQENTNKRGITFIRDERGRLAKAETDTGSFLEYAYNSEGMLMEVTDHVGRKVKLEYDGGMLKTVTTPSGAVYTYSYGDNGRITETVNARNVTAVRNRYDSLFRVTHQEFPDGGTMDFEYDDKNSRVTLTERNGSRITYVHDSRYRNTATLYEDGTREKYLYNDRNQCICRTDRNGHTVRMSYDSRGNLTQTVDAGKRRINFTYDIFNNLTSLSINGRTRLKNHYDSKGNLTGTTDALGNRTTIKNDVFGRAEKITYADGSSTELSYDRRGNITAVTDGNGNSTSYEYDLLNRVIKTTDANNNGIHFSYDASDRISTVTDALGNVRKYTYNAGEHWHYSHDALDRIIAITNPAGGVAKFTYDALGRVTKAEDENGNTTCYEYTPNGNLAKVTDALGNETFYQYDAMGHLTQSSCTGANGEEPQNTTYTWDKEGHVLAVTDPLGDVERYTYDPAGRMKAKVDKDGYETAISYGADGQAEEIRYADGRTVSLTYNAIRQLEEVKDWLGTTKIAMDEAGRVSSVTDPYGKTVGYEWGSMGERTAVLYPDGRKAAYEYNKAMQLTAMKLISNMEQEKTIRYCYDEAGRLTGKQFPGGNRTDYHYNGAGKVEEILHTGADFTERYHYGYDVMGNKITAEKERPGLPEDSGSFSYGYDELNRLIHVSQNGKTLRAYGYDAFGNRSRKTEYQTAGELVTTYRYNTKNQLMQETDAHETKDYAYDHRGNLLSVTSGEEVLKAYGFDATNQMSSSMGRTDGTIQKAVYQYNGLGHRMRQRIATGDAAPARTIRYTLDLTRQYHNLLQKTTDRRTDGNLLHSSQVYFWDGNVAGMKEEGRDHFYFQDDLGSPMRLTDETGRSEEAYGFDEFGNNIRTAKDIFQDSMQSFGFTGYQMDSAGGLYFAQARRYDSGIGRFVSEDIMRGHIAVPFTMNHYSYCWNRPMDLVDLNGKFPSWRDLKKFWNKYIYGEDTIGSSTNTVVTGKNWGIGTYHSEVYDITKTSDKYTGSWIKNVTTLGNDGNSQSYSLNIPSADLGKGNKFGIPTSLGVTFSNGGVSLDANIGIDLGQLNVNIPISIGLNWDNLVSVDASLNGGWADNSYGLDLSAGLHPGSNVKLGVHEKHAVDEKTTIKTENGVYMRMGYVYVVVIAAAAMGSMLYGNDPSSAGQTIINFINNFVNNGVCPALQ